MSSISRFAIEMCFFDLSLWFTDTQCEEFLIQVILNFFSNCNNKPFPRLTFVLEFERISFFQLESHCGDARKIVIPGVFIKNDDSNCEKNP